MRQQILADRVPRVTGPQLDGVKILKPQRMVERSSRGLQRQRRFANTARVVAQPMRQRNDRTTRFIVLIAGKPEASLGDLQGVIMCRRPSQRGGKRQRLIGLLERLAGVGNGLRYALGLTRITA